MVPPCRGFTPSLVKFRNANKDDFEVVFVSSDRDAKAQEIHERLQMKWPAVKNGSAEARKLKKQFEVRGIPKLVILDQNGKTLTTDGRGAVSRNPGGAIVARRNLPSRYSQLQV